jgi:hypothetical protein
MSDNPFALHPGFMSDFPESLRMEVYSSVRQVDRLAWQALRDPCALLTDLDYLKAIEESQVLDCQYRYFAFFRASELVCTLAGYCVETDIASLSDGPVRRMVLDMRKVLPGFLKIRTLEIGSPIALGLTVSRKPGLSQDSLREIIHQLKTYAAAHGEQLLLFRDFSDPPDPLEEALLAQDFALIPSVPAARLPVIWRSFDDYVSDLRYKYRNNLKRSQKRKEVCRIQTVITNDGQILSHLQELCQLSQNVHDHATELPRERIGLAYHQAMYDHFRRPSRWLLYFQDQQLVAYLHLVAYNRSMTAQYIGLDYQVSHQAQLYFNIGYDLIRYAIENGVNWIDGGATSYTAKSAAGFSIFPQRLYIHHKNPLAHWIARKLPVPLQDETSGCHYVFHDQQHQTIWQSKKRRQEGVAQ